tara:strand:+ start:279 stop:536 length:258 start_codon:yes stop_codon:yes gene_type:complete
MGPLGSPKRGFPFSSAEVAALDDTEKFCANSQCVLHVAPADANVEGRGDWATLENGLVFARVRVGKRFYCHTCAEHVTTALELSR